MDTNSLFECVEALFTNIFIFIFSIIPANFVSLCIHKIVFHYSKNKYKVKIKFQPDSIKKNILIFQLISMLFLSFLTLIISEIILKDTIKRGYLAVLLLIIIVAIFITSFIFETQKESWTKALLLLFPFTYEYMNADYYKQSITSDYNIIQKQARKEMVKGFNMCNCFVSIVIIAVALLVLNKGFYYPRIIIFPIIYRLIGRSCEIIRAFYIDVTKKEKKNTSLSSSERINLAIISLVEIVFLYAFIFYILNDTNFLIDCSKTNSFIDELLLSFGIVTYRSVDFKDFGLSTNIFIVFQVITSMVLIVFSIARYLGDDMKVQPSIPVNEIDKYPNSKFIGKIKEIEELIENDDLCRVSLTNSTFSYYMERIEYLFYTRKNDSNAMLYKSLILQALKLKDDLSNCKYSKLYCYKYMTRSEIANDLNLINLLVDYLKKEILFEKI